MTKRRVHAEPRSPWLPAEDATLRAQYPYMPTRVVALMLGRSPSSTYQRAYTLGLHKSEEFFGSPASGRTTGRQGIGSRFVKGQTSWNLGTRGVMKRNRTSFAKGHMPRNWKPVGSTRVNSEGYLDIKIDNTAKGPRAWAAVHRLNWIAAHGPIPKGMFIRFKDGNQRNPLVENLEVVDRAAHLARNWHDRYPKSIKQLVQLRGAIARQINRRNREQD